MHNNFFQLYKNQFVVAIRVLTNDLYFFFLTRTIFAISILRKLVDALGKYYYVIRYWKFVFYNEPFRLYIASEILYESFDVGSINKKTRLRRDVVG